MNTSKIYLLTLFILLALTAVLSACGKGTVTEVMVDQETTKTQTGTIIPASTSTVTPLPTKNIMPGWEIEQATTRSAYDTLVAPYLGNCSNDIEQLIDPSFLISPDGNWLAESCYSKKFIVSNRDGSKYWEIPFNVPSGDSPEYSSALCGAEPIAWSNESKYIYFKLYYCVEPSIIGIHWYRIDQVPDELYVMDTSTGEWYVLTPEANLFSFSPTGRRLLFISVDYFHFENTASLIDITVLDLQTGEEIKYSLTDYLVADYVVWSEDGTQAFFSAERGLPVYVSQDPHTYSIYRIDMLSQTMSMVYTFPDSENIIYTADYMDDENLLVLNSENYTTYMIETLYLDPNTGELFEEPPTP